MALRDWRDHFVTLITDLAVIRRGREVVLWRLRQTPGSTEAACSFTEPAPEIFHVLVTCNGRPGIRRRMRGMDTLVSWSESLKERLRAAGWYEVDSPEQVHRGLAATSRATLIRFANLASEDVHAHRDRPR